MMKSPVETLPKTVFSAEQTRELDRIAIQEYGIPGFELMRRAANFSLEQLLATWPNTKMVIALCGKGNNAGDAYLVAMLAKLKGLEAQCIHFVAPNTLSGDAKSAYEQCHETEVHIAAYNYDTFRILLEKQTSDCIIVDGLFGTGLNRDLDANYADAIELSNTVRREKSNIHTISLDIPSGLSANTGRIFNACIEADLTTTFIANKIGLMTGVGRHYSGQIAFHDLNLIEGIFSEVPSSLHLPKITELLEVLPAREQHTHKGKQGRALLVGGNKGFGGAILIASQACARVGAGLTSVITHEDYLNSVILHQPEVMAHTYNPIESNTLFEMADVIAIGPGLGKDEWAERLLKRTLNENCFKVLDADALNILAENPILIESLDTNTLITPHPGEAARLLDCSTTDIEEDRIKAIKALRAKLNCHVTLKGSGTLITHPNTDLITVCRYGNPGMAAGGMGDALTGIAAALIAQTYQNQSSINDVIELAVCLHSHAADEEAAAHGERGLLASDLADRARHILNRK
ncbi:MAG: NAD(P)H-hydrate dehydratase [Oleiphilaceae bacterium]|nr:NAD(P)H-hydrate dehydratase [Oleiphilaceae bacterium]